MKPRVKSQTHECQTYEPLRKIKGKGNQYYQVDFTRLTHINVNNFFLVFDQGW